MMTLLFIWSYVFAIVGTLIPAGLLAYEIYCQICAGQPLLTRFTIEFAVVIALTEILVWTLWVILMSTNVFVLSLVFWGIVALWLASMLFWLYDTLKSEMMTLVVKRTEEIQRYVGEVACE